MIGDTVKFTDLNPHRVAVTGRTSYSLSAFGEHLIEDEIQDGVTTAANDINYSINDFSVGPLYPDENNKLGGHIYVVEFKDSIPEPAELNRFANILDRRLSERNEDYQAHRADGYGLRDPQIIPAQDGMFAAWMKSRGKLGGQNKVPRVINDQELLQNLLKFQDTYSN